MHWSDLGYFLWGEQQEVTRHKDETNIKTHWIPVSTGMTGVE
jgi:hypothetical protein